MFHKETESIETLTFHSYFFSCEAMLLVLLGKTPVNGLCESNLYKNKDSWSLRPFTQSIMLINHSCSKLYIVLCQHDQQKRANPILVTDVRPILKLCQAYTNPSLCHWCETETKILSSLYQPQSWSLMRDRD
jgi:hypothetical protein